MRSRSPVRPPLLRALREPRPAAARPHMLGPAAPGASRSPAPCPRSLGAAALVVGALVATALFAIAPAATAQKHHHPEEDGAAVESAHDHRGASWSAGAIGLLTHASPAVFGEDRTELYLTQPVLAGHLPVGGRVLLQGMLNLEGLTLQRGELNAGIWGEGYVDRRHPHTYLHEAVATVRVLDRGAAAASLTLGRGFAPFGTDDPMSRPFVKFPINHHLAQVLERETAIAAVRLGPVILEGGVFNGEEPTGPRDLPSVDALADSWAARLTLLPAAGVEVQGSRAFLRSPEFPGGFGLDQRKWSASARVERPLGAGAGYALVEWARTLDVEEGRALFRFSTLLAEGSARHPWGTVAARVERTTRPDVDRLIDPFRSPQPHLHTHVLGVSRWTLATVRAGRELHLFSAVRVEPFVEVSRARVSAVIPSAVFVPREFYGSDRLWSLSAGLRVGAGAHHPRMGRYGAALAATH